MSFPGQAATAALAASLCAALLAIWSPDPRAPQPAPVPSMRHAAPPPPRNAAAAAAVILARPLFVRGRRPASPAGAPPARADALPRLAGTMILPGRRLAIFADGQKTEVREEGQSLRGMRIEQVAPGRVVLRRGDAMTILPITWGMAGAGTAAIDIGAAGEMPREPPGAHEE